MRAKISHVNVIVASLAFLLSLALLFSPLDVHAADVSFDATIMSGNFPSDFYYCVSYAPTGYYTNGQCANRYWASTAQNQVRYDSGNTSISGIKFFTPSGYTGAYNDIVQVEFDIMQGSGQANNAIDISLIGFRSNTSNFDVIDVSPVRTTNNTTHVKALLWAKGAFNPLTPIILIPANVETANSNNYSDNFIWFREVGDLVVGGLVNVYHIRSSASTQFDDTQVLNSIQSVVDAVEESSNAQQDIYEDEKDTINDSKDEAQDTADTMDTSGFTFGNPLATWFGMFSNNQCVSIPKLKAWLHGTENQVCSPWSSDVRSNLTPVASILSIMVAFGLLIHWLKGDSDVGLENT